MLNDIKVDDYIIGYECVGYNSKIRMMRGWVDSIIKDKNGKVEGFNIQADDNYKGNRGTMLMLEYGNIEYIDSDNLRPYVAWR